jgi:hypothetical protein
MIPWFKMYAAETLSDERFQGWTVDERGAWLTLLLVAWREGSIPSDQGSLARLLHVDSNVMRLLWSAIGNRFVPHEDHPGRLTSPRLEIEREDAARLIQKRAKAGEAGATSRWHKAKRENSKRIANACDGDATSMRFDGDQDRTEQDNAGQGSAALSPREEGSAARDAIEAKHPHSASPLTDSVVRSLRASGKCPAYPSPPSRAPVEAAIAGVGVPLATSRILAAWSDSKPWLTFYLEAITGQSGVRKPNTRGMAPPSTDFTSKEATEL